MFFRSISSQVGLKAGFTFKHLVMRSVIAGFNPVFLRTGALVALKVGRSPVRILCAKKPNDQISIFSKLSLKRFSGKIIFYFIYGA
jgi:hypothetical protein